MKRTFSRMKYWRMSGGVSMSVRVLPVTMTPQSPRRARGFSRASWQAGQSQKNAGTPQPAPVPMNVNVC